MEAPSDGPESPSASASPSDDAAAATITTVIAGVVAVVVLLLILGVRFRSRSAGRGTARRRDAALIVGVSGEGDAVSVGKTTLFKVLKNGRLPKHGVVSSLEPNTASVPVSADTSVTLIDYPGHPRLLPTLTLDYLPRATCIIQVVDAVRFPSQARRDAALLHTLLTHPSTRRHATPILIYCNKADISAAAVSTPVIRTRLQDEVDAVARAAATLRSTAGDGGAAEEEEEAEEEDGVGLVPASGDAFNFRVHAPCAVEFARGSALLNQVDPVRDFLVGNGGAALHHPVN